MTNPTQALDAIEQALQAAHDELCLLARHRRIELPQVDRNMIETLTHLATLKQQVAELVAFREAHQWQPISELKRGIKGEVLFIYRLGGDGPIEDTFVGEYCDSKEPDHDWFDCFLNPSANAIHFYEAVREYTHFCVLTPPAAEGGQNDG